MLEDLVGALIESFADAIVGVAVTVAEDHQVRRDKLAEYEAKAKGHANALGDHVAGAVQVVVRNRYKDWLADPRLGHEQPAAELRAAEISLNETVVALKANPSVVNRALSIGASIRLMAITQALGIACIYDKAATRSAPIKAGRVTKPVRAGDKRMNRRAISTGDIPGTLLPLVARLGISDPERITALGGIEAHCGGPVDIDGIATRLVALAALAEHQGFIDQLAKQVGAAIPQSETMPRQHGDEPVAPPAEGISPGPAAGSAPDAGGTNVDASSLHGVRPADRVEPVMAPVAALTVVQPAAVTPEVMATIEAISNFVDRNRWALNAKNGRYGLKKLGKRSDLNSAFDGIANLPAMQAALARVAASPPPPKS